MTEMQLRINERQEEVLEAIWCAGENKKYSLTDIQKKCSTDIIAEDLLALEQQGMIVKTTDKVVFSSKGKEHAEAIIRRHRLAEVLVTSILKLKKTEMERIACQVEHSLLPEVEESICTLLGHPEVCPDGRPIPQGPCCKNGHRTVNKTVTPLNELEPGEQGKITYIKPGSHSNWHQLMSFGLMPGVVVAMHRKKPAFCIKFEQMELALDEEIVKNIFVWKIG
ncbi:MAG: metal-dependent transcriptional regulator [SAR324 cluster bacterium]|nr:metal-dependent transcriptional regulator [SAR324 cluster bacterium]